LNNPLPEQKQEDQTFWTIINRQLTIIRVGFSENLKNLINPTNPNSANFNHYHHTQMKSKHFFSFLLFLSMSFLLTTQESQAQYGQQGYGGGYGGRGYGGGGYGGSNIPQTPSKPKEFDPEVYSTEQTRWMTKKLKLTEEQIPKVDNVNINYSFKRMDFEQDAKKILPPYTEEMRAKFREKAIAIKDERDKGMKAILTEEQYTIYLKKRDD
jgi:hypothetical protein